LSGDSRIPLQNMKNLPNLFKIVELTRAQVQYGYLLSGIKKDQLSNLAEHHYLVTFIGWQLALNLKQAGANIDVLKVLEFCLIHDLGELMGGDISGWYGKMNPRAKKMAKTFEEENQRFLTKFFGNDSKRFRKMAKEILIAKSDEALIAKVADNIEALNFKVYIGAFREADKKFNSERISGFIRKVKDKVAKNLLDEFVNEWLKNVESADYIEILDGKSSDELVYE
jgi:5'-deoxynucleotidase YfbR-like HD superfamily hydrolase